MRAKTPSLISWPWSLPSASRPTAASTSTLLPTTTCKTKTELFWKYFPRYYPTPATGFSMTSLSFTPSSSASSWTSGFCQLYCFCHLDDFNQWDQVSVSAWSGLWRGSQCFQPSSWSTPSSSATTSSPLGGEPQPCHDLPDITHNEV